MPELEEAIKKKYNQLVVRRNKADEFYNNPNGNLEKQMQWMPEYQELLKQLSVCITQFERVAGRQMTSEEIWEGFKNEM